MNRIRVAMMCLAVAGCAGEYSGPVSGVIGREPAQGSFTAKLSGAGTFWAMTTRGLKCEGIYDSLTTAPTITAAVTCNDGRTGSLIITRSMDMLSGTAIGLLSNGTEARFVFGDIAFEQATGVGAASRTVPVR